MAADELTVAAIRAELAEITGDNSDEWYQTVRRYVAAHQNRISWSKIYDCSTIGGRLRAARELAGLIQRKFGDRVGFTQREVSRLEAGIMPLPMLKVPGICMCLDISRDWLLTGEGRGPKVTHGLKRSAQIPSLAAQARKRRIVDENKRKLAEAVATGKIEGAFHPRSTLYKLAQAMIAERAKAERIKVD